MKFIAGKGFIKPLPFITAAVCLVVAIVFVVYDKAPYHLPAGIYGAWYSDDPRYQNCFLKISTDALLIRGADGNIYHYGFKSARQETARHSPGHVYILTAADQEGDELEFRFYFDAGAGILTYANQRNVVWTKAKREE